jgi:hypothetical protein
MIFGTSKFFQRIFLFRSQISGFFLEVYFKKVKKKNSKRPEQAFKHEKNVFLTLFFAGLLHRKETT